MNGIQIGDLGIFRTEEDYKTHIRERYSLPYNTEPYNCGEVDRIYSSPACATGKNPSRKVWRIGNDLPDVPYLWTNEAESKLMKYE